MFNKRTDGSDSAEPAKKGSVKKAAAAKKGAVKKSPVKKSPVKKSPVKKDAAKKSTAKKSAAGPGAKPKPTARPKAKAAAKPKAASGVRRAASGLRSLAEPSTALAVGSKARAAVQLHWSSRGGRAALAMLRALALLLLFLSVLELLRITLVPTPGSVGFVRPNMHPFATIRLYLQDGTIEEQIFQIGGNIALGFILGFLMPQITPYLRGLIRVEIVAVLFISLIEVFQHFFIPGTTLTVDDVILTAGGAALGYVPLGRMFGMRLHPYHLHWWQRILSRRAVRRAGEVVSS